MPGVRFDHAGRRSACASGRARCARHRATPGPAARSVRAVCAGWRRVGLSRRLVAHDRVLRHADHLAVQQPVAGEVEGIDLDLGVVAVVHEADVLVRGPSPRSRRRLSAGTTTISACAGVTTPPTVCTASCCTVPSIGARNTWSCMRFSALTRSSANCAAFCSASASSVNDGSGDIRPGSARAALPAPCAPPRSRRRGAPARSVRARWSVSFNCASRWAMRLPNSMFMTFSRTSAASCDQRQPGLELGDRRGDVFGFRRLLRDLLVERGDLGAPAARPAPSSTALVRATS